MQSSSDAVGPRLTARRDQGPVADGIRSALDTYTRERCLRPLADAREARRRPPASRAEATTGFVEQTRQ
ncbi:hypothetical protein CDD83_9488 [Cordyceps sp. RAO-2017]|nr:hypothetical protein CDD83_9488 [Cordyceps sp. RAO-2017]